MFPAFHVVTRALRGRSRALGARALATRTPAASARVRIDSFDDEEYYYDEADAEPHSEADAPYRRRSAEYLSLLRVPAAMDAALQAVSMPELPATSKARRAADAPPSVHEFAAQRLDLAYAACRRVLHEACVRLPGLAPERALDFGAGLAPFAWAARETWGSRAPTTIAVEPNPMLRSVGTRLGATGRLKLEWRSALPSMVEELPADFAPPDEPLEAKPSYDLVTSAYALGALPRAEQDHALLSLWSQLAEGGLFALIEPATASGFGSVLRARELLAGAASGSDEPGGLDEGLGDTAAGVGARVVAPCPHALACPLQGGGVVLPWAKADKREQSAFCHVTQRIVESEARRYLNRRSRRGGERRNITEPFCYLLLQRPHSAARAEVGEEAAEPGSGAAWARVLRTPRKRKGHILLDVCAPEGQARSLVVSKGKTADRELYKRARRLNQGESWGVARAGKAGAAEAEARGERRGRLRWTAEEGVAVSRDSL